jgi:uncharacterized protein YndB with AHSA1/START domain
VQRGRPTAGMSVYTFRMVWKFEASIDTVWELINQPDSWPLWWKNCRHVERLSEGDASGEGAARRFSMQTQLPYTLQFLVTTTQVSPPRLLDGKVSGQLEGNVRWELSQNGDTATTVRYYWDVAPTRAWMRLLSPVLRPVFVWNHRSMMRNAGRAFSKMMNSALLFEEYR